MKLGSTLTAPSIVAKAAGSGLLLHVLLPLDAKPERSIELERVTPVLPKGLAHGRKLAALALLLGAEVSTVTKQRS